MVGVIVVYEGENITEGVYKLSDIGAFEATGFRGVMRGKVEDLQEFLKKVEERIQPPTFLPVKRIVPIEEWFYFSPEKFSDIVKERIEKYAERIEAHESFCVRVERRGMKGVLSSKDLEREIGKYVFDLLKKRFGVESKVDLEDPDKMIVIEMIGNLAGLALICKKDRKAFPLIRVK